MTTSKVAQKFCPSCMMTKDINQMRKIPGGYRAKWRCIACLSRSQKEAVNDKPTCNTGLREEVS